jgi:hypothetical protein
LQLELERIELARGHDGFARGAPEPSVVLAVYRCASDAATLVARSVHRFRSPGPHPEVIEANGAQLEAVIPRVEGMRILVLALAFEEDSGRGIQSAYCGLAQPETLSLWADGDGDPEPRSLAAWTMLPAPAPPDTQSVHLLLDGRDLRDATEGDDWIGASAFHVADEQLPRLVRRMRFVSPDDENDWTAVLTARAV